MTATSTEQTPADPGTERLILLELLRGERCTREQLERELYDVDPDAIADALTSLAAIGAANLDGEMVRASAAIRRLDTLHMICL